MLEGAIVARPYLKEGGYVQRTLLILFVLSFAVCISAGCASLRKDYQTYIDCTKDPECMAYVQGVSSNVTTLSHGVTASIPATAPFDPFITSVVGGIVSVIAAFAYGKKRGKKSIT